jgi:uroporphyrinogen-III synthase
MPSLILTRTEADNRESAHHFEALSWQVLSAPMIELRAIPRDACGMRSVRRLAGGEPVLVTSAHAAELWLDLRESEFAEIAPEAYYVVGRRSAEILREADPDVPIRLVARSGEELLSGDLTGIGRLLYPCSAERRDTLVEGLQARGIDVIDLPLYRPVVPRDAAERLADAIAEAEPPVVIAFYSPSAVRNFHSLAPVLSKETRFAAIGETTAAALREIGITPLVADSTGSAALAKTLGRMDN